MILRFGFDKRTQQYFIMIKQDSTGNLSTVFTPTIAGITNFINIVKKYDKISIALDTSLTRTQQDNIKYAIQNDVQLP